MKQTIIGVLAVLFMLMACKQESEKKKPADNPSVEAVEKNELIVQFDFNTSQGDEFRIMLNNIEVDDLQKKNIAVRENIMPSTYTENITANFGENISNNLLFNLGNAIEKEVKVVAITVSYGKTSISVNSIEDLNKYFVFNKYIISDSTTTKLTVKKIDGKLFPMITARRRLINALKN